MLDLFGTAEKRFFYERSRADVGSSPRLTARQAANGTTIVICSAGTHAMNPFLYKRGCRSTVERGCAGPQPGHLCRRRSPRDTYGDTYAGAAVN